MKRKLFLPLLCLLLSGFAVYHVVRAGQQPPKAPPPNEPARTPFSDTIGGGGVVESRSENIAIGAHLPGIVSDVLVKVGDPVAGTNGTSRGTPLFRIDDRQLQSEYRVREAALNSARANLARLEKQPRPEERPPLEAKVREAEALLTDARDQDARARVLVKSRAIGEEDAAHRRYLVAIAEAQLAKANADLDLLNKGAWTYDIQIAKRNVEQAEQLLKQTATEIERLTVFAPIDGVVLQRNVRPGEFVGVPPSQPLLVIGDMSRTHVRIDIDESDIPRFRPGLAGRASPRGRPDQKIPLVFVRVEPMVVPKKSLTGAGTERVDTRVLQAIYAVDSDSASLFVGQQLDVYLDAGSK